MKKSLYVVLIQNENGQEEISRIFETVKAARKWAVWCSKKWKTRLMNQLGGIELSF